MSKNIPTDAQDFGQVLFHRDGELGVITLNRPEVMNAQGYEMLQQIDYAFDAARGDAKVRVVIVRGAGGVFSAGHDLGRGLAEEDTLELYDSFKKYNLDLLIRWRDFPKPTIAMVDGYCIYAGWMLAAAMDLVFASDRAQFLGGFVQYNTIPYDLGFRKAKEVCFESRFLTAEECRTHGFVSRVYGPDELEAETYAYARRVAENSPLTLRMVKLQVNKAQDAGGFRALLEDSLGDFLAMIFMPGSELVDTDKRRLKSVDLAFQYRKGERHGQEKSK
jgi:enoyl-CoA hydratase